MCFLFDLGKVELHNLCLSILICKFKLQIYIKLIYQFLNKTFKKLMTWNMILASVEVKSIMCILECSIRLNATTGRKFVLIVFMSSSTIRMITIYTKTCGN